jgi:hypothetical protein
LVWKNKHIQASCRKEDAEGLDQENIQYLNLVTKEVRQRVMETVQIWREGLAEMDQ